jgi:hypothetical protein
MIGCIVFLGERLPKHDMKEKGKTAHFEITSDEKPALAGFFFLHEKPTLSAS